jgi:hypothetical protein
MAKSIAHMGGYHFCVMLTQDKSFDEKLAVSRLCEDTHKSLCAEVETDTLPVCVGRVRYNPDRHISIDDMLGEADALFYGRGKEPANDLIADSPALASLLKWRKTIF